MRSTTSTTSTGAESSVTNHDVELDATDESGFGVGIEAPSSHVFTRDTAGRLTSSTNRFYTGVVTNDPLVITADASRYDYRADGRVARITNVDGAHEFTYDARGLVQTQTIEQGGTGESGTYAYGYDEVGRNISLTFADGHVRTQRYDDLGRLVERCYTYPTRPGVSDRCYGASYDAVGNVVSLSDPEGTETIEVDGLDRVKTVTRSTGGVESYAYNSLGALATNAGVALDAQRPRLDGGGMADAAVPATLNGAPVTLDRGGRVTLLRNTPLTFSRDGYLRDVGSGPTLDARFAVDTQRRRAWVSTPSALQAYVYEGANAVGVMRHRHVLGQHLDTPVQRWLFDGVDHPLRLTSFDYKVNTTTSPPTLGSDYNVVYFEVDLAGNVRRVRGQSGEDFGGFRYTAFGKQLEDTTSLGFLQPVPEISLRWKARPLQHLGGVEVYDMRARQWVPELGAFLSIDELRFHDSRSTLWGWPRQNPLRWSDPFGRNAVDYSGQTAALNALTNDLYGASAFFADRTAESWSQGWYGDAIFSASVTAATGLLGAASSLLPRRPDPGSAGAMMMCPIEGAAGAFANQLPGALGGELAAARAAGAKPISPGTPAFARALNQGTVKWVVTKNGDLVISPHTVNGVEISHAVLSGGEPVLAAGQAEVGVAGGQMTGIGITNQSGHFMPSVESTQIGREAFANHGIVFPE
ncbi:MAG: hypothetical protein U0270_17695 [Labilithrix sp.]